MSTDTKKIPYVLTLTILNAEKTKINGNLNDKIVRFCVRNSDVNPTHPDVVSVPTQRIPQTLAEAIIASSTECGKSGKTMLREQSFVSNKDVDGHNAVIFAVESLFSRKMGVADILERNEIEFSAALAGTHIGTAKYVNLGKEECLHMLNIQVLITKGADKFPDKTTSYDISGWMPVQKFLPMWDDGKDVTLAGINSEKAMGICVDGLCILSTYDILKSQTEAQ